MSRKLCAAPGGECDRPVRGDSDYCVSHGDGSIVARTCPCCATRVHVYRSRLVWRCGACGTTFERSV